MAHNLQDINDDCLREIFKKLTVPELAGIAATCTQFRTIARDVFSSYHKSNCLEMNGTCGNQSNEANLARRQQISTILRNFGDLITKVKVTFYWNIPTKVKLYNAFVFKMMVTYCTGTLERLEMVNCNHLQLDKIIDGPALFQNVKELILNSSRAIDGSFLSDAKQLIRLKINGFHSAAVVKFLQYDYPLLQSLALNIHPIAPSPVDIGDFLRRHRDLVEFESGVDGVCGWSLISKYCPKLRKLSIWDRYDYDISPISQLENLTAMKLTIIAGGEPPIQVLKASKSSQSLEELQLLGGGLSDYSNGD